MDGVASAAVESSDDGPACPAAPDPRFLLANERTFLAWNRTALALVAAGLAAAQLLDRLPLPGVRTVLAVMLVSLGGIVAVMSYRRWREVDLELARGGPPPKSALPQVLAITVLAAAVVAVVVLLSGGR